MRTWKQLEKLARAYPPKCPTCGNLISEGEEEVHNAFVWGWGYHAKCLNPKKEEYQKRIYPLLRKKDLPCLPYFEQIQGWGKMEQIDLKIPQRVPIAKIIGSASHISKDFYIDWFPVPPIDFRYERIIEGAFTSGNPAGFLDNIDKYKHLFYFKDLDQYYVTDGNRRTSIAHVLGIKTLKYYITMLR